MGETDAAAQRRLYRRLGHELANAATVFNVSLATLRERLEHDPSARSALASALERLGRLTDLARALGKLGTLELGVPGEPGVALGSVIDEAVEMVQMAPGAGDAAPAVAVRSSAAAATVVVGDRDLLVLAVYHLVHNALTFAGPAGAVTLTVRVDDGWAELAVADTGPGIPADELPQVVEPLFTGKGQRRRRSLGLGLTFTDAITRAHGGSLVIQSEPGRGTVATLRLPLAAQAPSDVLGA